MIRQQIYSVRWCYLCVSVCVCVSVNPWLGAECKAWRLQTCFRVMPCVFIHNIHPLLSVLQLRVKRVGRVICPVAGWIAAVVWMWAVVSCEQAHRCCLPPPPDPAGTCQTLKGTVIGAVNTGANRKCWEMWEKKAEIRGDTFTGHSLTHWGLVILHVQTQQIRSDHTPSSRYFRTRHVGTDAFTHRITWQPSVNIVCHRVFHCWYLRRKVDLFKQCFRN